MSLKHLVATTLWIFGIAVGLLIFIGIINM